MIYCVEILVPLLLLNIIKFTHSGLAISFSAPWTLRIWRYINLYYYYYYYYYISLDNGTFVDMGQN